MVTVRVTVRWIDESGVENARMRVSVSVSMRVMIRVGLGLGVLL